MSDQLKDISDRLDRDVVELGFVKKADADKLAELSRILLGNVNEGYETIKLQGDSCTIALDVALKEYRDKYGGEDE